MSVVSPAEGVELADEPVLSFSPPSPDQSNKEQIRAEVEAVRKQFAAMEGRKSALILDPTKMPRWDSLTISLLVFTALVSPYEVAFLKAPTSASDGLFILNRVIDVFFFADMVLQFFLMYEEHIVSNNDEALGGKGGGSHSHTITRWVKDRRKITVNYLRGWFAIDVGSILPGIFDILPLINPDECPDRGSNVKVLRVIRVLRLIKLVR